MPHKGVDNDNNNHDSNDNNSFISPSQWLEHCALTAHYLSLLPKVPSLIQAQLKSCEKVASVLGLVEVFPRYLDFPHHKQGGGMR